jgi:mono/diheme cytochrome c family protein
MHLGREVVVIVLSFASTLVFAQSPADADPIRRGEYVAIAGDCVACHSAPGGKPFAGGLPLPTPIGDIIATNITPSRTAGIGTYTLAQFADAMRRGVRADGAHLYPAMPYTAYANVTDDDIAALYAYFMHAVAPVDAAPPETRLPFPFNLRLLMLGWNMLFLDRGTFRPEPAQSAEWNRGAYLARGLAHCGTCHTPRNLLMAERMSRELGGGSVGVWDAPNITSDTNSGIGGWSVEELVRYMRVGHVAGKAQAAGPMAEAIDKSLRHLDEADLRSIATFVKGVPAVHDATDTRPRHAWGAAADDLPSIRGVSLPKDLDRMTGPQLYDAYCATCHQAQAQGSFDGGLPPLFHNAALGGANTDNLVLVMLQGIHRETEPPEIPMPGFAKLSDRELATLGAYVVRRYGNPAAIVTVEQVATLRGGGAPSRLVLLVQVAMAVGILAIAAAIVFLARRRRAGA